MLRPGGRLRLSCESLDGYRGGRERELWLADLDGTTSRLILFDRRPDAELALTCGLAPRLPRHDAARALGADACSLTFDQITPSRLAESYARRTLTRG